jgi:hypothetical protein
MEEVFLNSYKYLGDWREGEKVYTVEGVKFVRGVENTREGYFIVSLNFWGGTLPRRLITSCECVFQVEEGKGTEKGGCVLEWRCL